MKKIILLFISILPYIANCQTVPLSLEVEYNDVHIRWNYDNIIDEESFVRATLYRTTDKDTISFDFTSFDQNTYTDTSATINERLYKYHLIATYKYHDPISSDTISPIYFNLREAGIGNTNPKIECRLITTPLTIYRKYNYENTFRKVIDFTPPTYIDTTIITSDTINISYFVTNIDSTSISEIKSGSFKDCNEPELPVLEKMTIINDTSLLITWEPSTSEDVLYYKIHEHTYDTINIHDRWDSLPERIHSSQTQFIINQCFCNDIQRYKLYTILAYDSCNNGSLIGEITYMDHILSAPILESVTFDGCRTLSIKFNKFKTVGKKDISTYLKYTNDSHSGIIPIETENIYSHNERTQHIDIDIFNYFDEFNDKVTDFTIMSTNGTDTSFSCNKPLYINNISSPPDYYEIDNIDNDNITNRIKINVDNDVESAITYHLTKTEDNITTTIWEESAKEINTPTIIIEDTLRTDNVVIYNLIAKDSCETKFSDSTYISTMNLNIEENDSNTFEVVLSCNELITNIQDDIDYFIRREYDGNETTEDVTYEITNGEKIFSHKSDMIESSFTPITWQVEARTSEGIKVKSNSVYYKLEDIELKIPNAFIPDSDNEINRRFGPMNTFSESSLRSYRIEIYNNMGQLIWWTDRYSSENSGNNDISRWNGHDKRSGKKVTQGTYVYSIYIDFITGGITPIKKTGTVTLINK